MTAVDPTWDPPRPGWVCAECSFDHDATDPRSAADTVRSFAKRYRAPLTRSLPGEDLDTVLRARPGPASWSALEYACHVRDALALYDHRIRLVLEEDRPSFPKMGRDEVAVARDYNGQDPVTVADELATAAERLASRLDAVPDAGWRRVGVREDLEMSVEWMARNAVHEGAHHLLDVGRALRAARGR